MMGILVPVVLSIGAIYALVPLMVIVALIAAAAGLSRGASIFQFFGFDALVGLAGGVGAGAAGKGISKAVRYQSDKAEQLTEAMRTAHANRSGMSRGVGESREVKIAFRDIKDKDGKIITKRGITRMATSKERGTAITALKALYDKAGLQLPADIEAKITDKEAKNLTKGDIRQIRKMTTGDRTGLGLAVGALTTVAMVVPVVGGIPRVIENAAVHRSSRVMKLGYTGPKPSETGSFSKQPVPDLYTGQSLKSGWDQLKSFSSESKESKKIRDEKEKQEAMEARKELQSKNPYAARLAAATGPLEVKNTWSGKASRALYEDWGVGAIASSAVVMQQAFKIMTSSGQAQQKYAKELFDSYKTEEKVSSAAPFVPNSDVTRSTTPISDYTGWNGYLKAMSGAYKAALVDATVGTIYKPWYDKYTESGRDEKRKEEEKKKAEEQAQKEKDAMKKAEEDAAAKSEEGAAE